MNIKTFTTASFTTIALGAALLFAPITSSPVRADPAPNPCATDVFSPECARKMAYDVCKAGGGAANVALLDRCSEYHTLDGRQAVPICGEA